MKILLLGAGAQGSVIAAELAKSREVSEVKIADIDLKRAKVLAERLKSERLSAQRLDVSNLDDVARAAEGMDVVINAVGIKFNKNIMVATLKSGACYQDLASEYVTEKPPFSVDQLEFDDEWKKAECTALIDMGLAPGVTDIVAKEVTDRLDRVDKIRVTLFYKIESKEMISSWAPEIAWGDMAEEPVVFKNGKFKKVPPFSGEETYVFPEPIGQQTIVWHAHEESILMPLFIGKGIKNVGVKIGGEFWSNMPLAATRAIVQLGLMNDKPMDVKGVKVSPRDLLYTLTPRTLSTEEVEKKIKTGVITGSYGCILIDIEGEEKGEKVHKTLQVKAPNIIEIQKKIPGVYDLSYMTSVPAALIAIKLGRGEIKTKGVVPPEGLEPKIRKELLTELAKKDIVVHERTEKCLA